MTSLVGIVLGRAVGSQLRALFRRRLARRLIIGTGVVASVAILAVMALWVRLASGPISLDLATPWLARAIAENFGSQHRVEVGGTQIERDDDGRMTLRLRDIVVRDRDGSVVASAPKAEVALSGSGLLSGNLRAEKLRLVGAKLTVRIEADGTINVFTGNDKRPIAMAKGERNAAPIASAPPLAQDTGPMPQSRPASGTLPTAAAHDNVQWLSALLTWIDGLGESGLDGHDLSELGLKNGTLIVKDERTKKAWTLTNIDVGLRRPHGGGVLFKVSSEQPEKRWSLTALVTPRKAGLRSMQLEASNVPSQELLLALRLGDLPVEADMPLSARLRVEIGPAGTPNLLEGARGRSIWLYRRSGKPAATHRDRPGGGEFPVGCRTARPGRADPDHFWRQPIHAAGADRPAAPSGCAMAVSARRRQYRAGGERAIQTRRWCWTGS